MSRQLESSAQIRQAVEKVSEIVSERAGIQLGERQFRMVKSRLSGRMLRLKISQFSEYLEYLNKNIDDETEALISLLTTHHTFFFREFAHFEFLLNHGMDRLIQRARSRGDRKIRIWSAASSRGQEAYSLAMFFQFHLSALAPDVDFEVWGTDIDPQSVKWARNGVFRAEELKQAPAMYVNQNWTRGRSSVKDFTRVKTALKNKCQFQVANLLSCQEFLKGKTFDVIFCRNVFIYFDPQQIKQCTQSLLPHLDREGFLVLGVSESLNGMSLPAQAVGPSTYQHIHAGKSSSLSVAPAPERQKIFRVLCVDDSPTILTILQKILDEKSGFKVVATAPNGLKAMEILKTTSVDIITLDLHMPEMDGVGFLQTYTERSAPVVIVSSVNRDDLSLGQKALELGASDYIEKPSLENMAKASNELRSKLKTVLGQKKSKPKVSSSPAKKKVLIVDDSATIRQLLEKIISSDPELEVVGMAERPSQVEDLIRKTKPDLITLDIHMPEMDGVSLLRKIQPLFGIPTVMISSISKEEGPQVLQALELGAIDYIQKPEAANLAQVAPQIRERLKAATKASHKPKVFAKKTLQKFSAEGLKSLILLGASTGGTEALRVVLESLPREIPPILIVQHIPAGFSGALARRLNDLVPFEVKEAVDGDEVRSNLVLIAPGGQQMALQSLRNKLIVKISSGETVSRHKPSVDFLFRSAVHNFNPQKIVAAVMTGMGNDGASGLKELRDQGARTIAQDQASCVVFGMPREAIENGGAQIVAPLSQLGQTLFESVEKRTSAPKSTAPRLVASKKIA